jgi:hypothetical protein
VGVEEEEIVLHTQELMAALVVEGLAELQEQQVAQVIPHQLPHHRVIAEERGAAQIHTEVAVVGEHLLVVQQAQVVGMVEMAQHQLFQAHH